MDGKGVHFDKERVSRFLILTGSVVLFVTVVVLEPRTVADMVVAGFGTASLLVGLYLSRRAEMETQERAEREAEVLSGTPDVVPEGDELPRREPFGGQD